MDKHGVDTFTVSGQEEPTVGPTITALAASAPLLISRFLHLAVALGVTLKRMFSLHID